MAPSRAPAWRECLGGGAAPKSVIPRLNAETVKALNDADIRKRFLDLATDPVSSTPEELGALIRSEVERWTKVVKQAGIKAD
jgi:tripartite-type tricarboxylate transporter receptor subunit TctC